MELTPYVLPMEAPFLERRGVYVKTEAGMGEIAPWPGTHKESLEEAIEALKKGDHSLPSVAFALDMANYLKSSKRAGSYRLIIDSDPLPKEPSSVKLKVGRDLRKDLERIKTLDSLGCSMRLDANRSFTLEEAVAFAKECEGLNIEYMEEPLKKSAELSLFYRETGMPIALDETLYLNEPWEDIEGLSALILKVGALGPLARTRALAEEGKERGLRIVISSCFESPLTTDFLSALSAELAPKELAGLDTVRFFQTVSL